MNKKKKKLRCIAQMLGVRCEYLRGHSWDHMGKGEENKIPYIVYWLGKVYTYQMTYKSKSL